MIRMECLSDQPILPFADIDYNQFRDTSVPIIIDWGAYRSRVGFATEGSPQLVFRSLISKQRAKKDSEVLVGNEILDIEAVKRVLRSPFEFDVVTQFDTMETIFDYMFINLGIDTNRVEHPIVLNEPLCVPLWTRSNTQELLFECYGIPSLMLGVDHLFSLHHNLADIENCLIISLGHYTIHVTVITDGTVCCERSKRINLGGLNLSLYLQRLLQLKYPKLTQEFTFTKCEQIVQKLCHFSQDYDFESCQWSREDYYNKNIKRFKASVDTKVSPTPIENFSERSQRLLQKVENKLFRRRETQLIELEENKKKCKTLLEMVEDEELADPVIISRAYQNTGVRNLSELRTKLNEIICEIRRIRAEMNPKLMTRSTVIDEIKEWQKQNSSSDESQWVSYIRLLRNNKIGENAWILNEILREYELDLKRLKRHGIADNVIELGPELIRVPELFFSPNALISYPQMGVTEAIEEVIKQLDNSVISQTIYLTGGCANLDGVTQRVLSDVTSIRPFQSPLTVLKAEDVSTDAWRGGRDCSQIFSDKFVTKEEYQEFGSGYIKEFKCSNKYRF